MNAHLAWVGQPGPHLRDWVSICAPRPGRPLSNRRALAVCPGWRPARSPASGTRIAGAAIMQISGSQEKLGVVFVWLADAYRKRCLCGWRVAIHSYNDAMNQWERRNWGWWLCCSQMHTVKWCLCAWRMAIHGYDDAHQRDKRNWGWCLRGWQMRTESGVCVVGGYQ